MINPLSITDNNLSIAWARTFLELMKPGEDQRHPAIITINDLEDQKAVEHSGVRSRLDAELDLLGLSQCKTVAGTLFPRSMWNPALADDATSLYTRYNKAWPAIAKCPANRKGVYFRRLTAYAPKDYQGTPVNQLDFVAKTYQAGNHRKSALQAAILDPTRDHTNNRVKGFPCLQQVAFTPFGQNKMSITGYYATQYQFEKAYGNYLGLYWLGRFMAKQFKLELAQVVCVASVLSLGNSGKGVLTSLQKDLQQLV